VRPRGPALALALLAAAACGKKERDRKEGGGAAPPAADAAPVDDGRLRLVVVVVIDQLPSWSFDPMREHLTGGLGRLLREGTYFVDGQLPYGNTFTASGHAAIATGAPPAVTGIVANDWHRPGDPGPRGSAEDPDSPLLGPNPSVAQEHGRSSKWLQVEGVADVLERETGGRAHTVALSLKDRSAILVLGKRPDLALWWDPYQTAMITSRFYAERVPAWATVMRGERTLAACLLEETWTPNDPALLARLSACGDDQAGEGGNDEFGRTFPHELPRVPQPAKALLNTPFGTELLLETAAAAIDGEKLGQDGVTDLLGVSISSHDYAGHGWGQESWERYDVLLDIDRRLGGFLDTLDQKVGRGRWAVLLTSDHGALPLVERQLKAGVKVYRLSKLDVATALDKAARRAIGARGPWVRGLTGNMVHTSAAFTALPEAKKKKGMAAMIAAAKKIPGIGFAVETGELVGDCSRHQDEHRQRACRSIPPDMVDNIYVQPVAGSQYAGDHPWGAGHGCDSPQERTVPILVLAPGRTARRVETPVSLLQVAPTVSALLSIPPPPAATEPPLP
jgi:hypothetical protein